MNINIILYFLFAVCITGQAQSVFDTDQYADHEKKIKKHKAVRYTDCNTLRNDIKVRAENNDPEAQYEYGLDLFHNYNNFDDGIRYFKAAAKNGHKNAIITLSNIGMAYYDQNQEEKAFSILRFTADLEDCISIEMLGDYYFNQGGFVNALKYYSRLSTTNQTIINRINEIVHQYTTTD